MVNGLTYSLLIKVENEGKSGGKSMQNPGVMGHLSIYFAEANAFSRGEKGITQQCIFHIKVSG